MNETVCQCEHIIHEIPNEAIHPDLDPNTIGEVLCYYVGLVCRDCAETHMKEYVVSK